MANLSNQIGSSVTEGGSSGSSTITIVSTSASPYDGTEIIEETLVQCTLAGNQTINLPSATNNGLRLNIKKKSSSGIVTITPSGSEVIDGESSIELNTQYSSWTLVADGLNWNII